MKKDVVVGLLDKFHGAKFIGIDIITTPQMNKTVPGAPGEKRQPNPDYGRITKMTRGMNVMVASNTASNAYLNMVRRRLAAEGKDPDSFQLGERAWGVRIPNTPFVEHNGAMYLEVIALHPGTTVYMRDGQEVPAADIQGIRTSEVGEEQQGGLTNKVVIRSVKFDSIHALRLDGVEVKSR